MKFSIFICKCQKVLESNAWVGSENCCTIQQTGSLVALTLFSQC